MVKKDSERASDYTFGRPRKYDLEQEGNDLLEWAKKDDSLIMKSFAVPKEYTYEHMLAWVREGHSEYFSQCYEKAIAIVADRREKMALAGTIPQKYFDRFATLYDKDLRRHERELKKEQIEDEIAIKKADVAQFTDDQLKLNQDILAGITALQKRERES